MEYQVVNYVLPQHSGRTASYLLPLEREAACLPFPAFFSVYLYVQVSLLALYCWASASHEARQPCAHATFRRPGRINVNISMYRTSNRRQGSRREDWGLEPYRHLGGGATSSTGLWQDSKESVKLNFSV